MKLSPAVLRQRRGLTKPNGIAVAEMQAPNTPTKRRYDTTNRPRRSPKASGSGGLYHSPEWRARRKAWLKERPDCVMCGQPATIADHVERVTDPNSYEQVILGEIQSMCGPCHQQKSADDGAKAAGREPKPIKRRVEIDPKTGYPLAGQPWHPWSE